MTIKCHIIISLTLNTHHCEHVGRNAPMKIEQIEASFIHSYFPHQKLQCHWTNNKNRRPYWKKDSFPYHNLLFSAFQCLFTIDSKTGQYRINPFFHYKPNKIIQIVKYEGLSISSSSNRLRVQQSGMRVLDRCLQHISKRRCWRMWHVRSWRVRSLTGICGYD